MNSSVIILRTGLPAGRRGIAVIIETERLILRDFQKSDWKEVHEYSADPEVSYFMEWGPNTKEETLNFVDSAMGGARQKPRRLYELAVILKGEAKLIGACGLRLFVNDAEQADIGYCYNKNYWRKGYGTEACRALVDFAFGKLDLHRVIATCDADNIGSACVLAKSGMRKEAHFRSDKKVKGRWRDTFLFAILKDEWKPSEK